jgi:hypothetical protein
MLYLCLNTCSLFYHEYRFIRFLGNVGTGAAYWTTLHYFPVTFVVTNVGSRISDKSNLTQICMWPSWSWCRVDINASGEVLPPSSGAKSNKRKNKLCWGVLYDHKVCIATRRFEMNFFRKHEFVFLFSQAHKWRHNAEAVLPHIYRASKAIKSCFLSVVCRPNFKCRISVNVRTAKIRVLILGLMTPRGDITNP